MWLVFALQESKLTLKRLRRLLFGKHLKVSPALAAASESSQTGGHETTASGVLEADAVGSLVTAGEAPAAPSPSPQQAKPKGGHRPGTGRLGADAYVGAERVECRHEELAASQRCPVCGQGNLYELPPGVEIRIDGHALLSAMRYELQKLRCSGCGQMFTAPLPKTAGEDKYSPRARAVRVVGRYYLGLPFYRIEGDQAMLGVPMPDATQWDQIDYPRILILDPLLHNPRSRNPETAWKRSIRNARDAIDDLVADHPSLRTRLAELCERAYPRAARDAHNELSDYGDNHDSFPTACPLPLDELLDHEFWPR